MVNHWEHTIVVDKEEYKKFVEFGIPVTPDTEIPYNTAVYVSCIDGGKRIEAINDPEVGIRKITQKAPNKDLRLYLDAVSNENITVIAVDGLMGTGKTYTCVESVVNRYLKKVRPPEGGVLNMETKPYVEHKVLIAKPYVNAGGKHEQYGYLPGDLDSKIDPTLNNFIQYFDRMHMCGFNLLRNMGYIDVLPLGFIRGLDASNMTLIVDECQNTKELVTVVTRKAKDSRIFLLGDTSPFQIDMPGNTPENNGLTKIIDLLKGAPYFQHIELKSLEHIMRSKEVKDVVKRLFKSMGKDPTDWSV